MIKKALILVSITTIMVFAQAGFAINIEQATDKLVGRLNIDRELSSDIIKHYKDWRYVDNFYKLSVSSAIREGILLPSNRIISPKSEDISPIIKGLTYYGLKNPQYSLVIGTYTLQKIGNAIVDLSTMVIIGNEFSNMGFLTDGMNYTALVDKDNKAVVVWRQNGVIIPTILRGKLFYNEGNRLILTSVEKSNFDKWDSVTNKKYTTVELGNIGVTQKGRTIYTDELNSNFLDGYVYILVDKVPNNNENINPLYVEVSN